MQLSKSYKDALVLNHNFQLTVTLGIKKGKGTSPGAGSPLKMLFHSSDCFPLDNSTRMGK